MVSLGNLTTSERLRELLGASSSTPKSDLLFHTLINAGSSQIRAMCKRTFKYGSSIEYQNADGGNFILLDNYPVISVSEVNVDTSLAFTTSTVLEEDDDYSLDSRIGKLELINSLLPIGVKAIKVQYTYGPTSVVVLGSNRRFNFIENGTEKTATVAEGAYNAMSLASAVESALDSAAGANIAYDVSYAVSTESFTITASGAGLTSFGLKSTHDASKYLYQMMGFSTTVDHTGVFSYESDEPAPIVDPVIEGLLFQYIQYMTTLVTLNKWNVRADVDRDGTSTAYFGTSIPEFLRQQIMVHSRRFGRY